MISKSSNVIFIVFLILFACIALFPFLWVISSSLKTTMEIFTGVIVPERLRWETFPQAWKAGNLAQVTLNSVIVTAAAVLFGLSVDVLAGYSFAKLAIGKHPWVFYIYLIALAVPLDTNAFSIYLQIRQLDLDNTLKGITLALVGSGTAFGTFLMRNFFKDISNSFRESAIIDGASEFKVFSNIFLPLVTPAVGALAIFKALYAWNEYNMSLFILIQQSKWTIPLAVATFRTWEMSHYNYIFAAATLSFLPTVILYIVFNRSFIEGISVGGVKG